MNCWLNLISKSNLIIDQRFSKGLALLGVLDGLLNDGRQRDQASNCSGQTLLLLKLKINDHTFICYCYTYCHQSILNSFSYVPFRWLRGLFSTINVNLCSNIDVRFKSIDKRNKRDHFCFYQNCLKQSQQLFMFFI